MKVFDTHFHIENKGCSARALLNGLDETGVERACIIAPSPAETNSGGPDTVIYPPNTAIHECNVDLSRLVDSAPDRLVGLARLNPLAQGALDEIQWAYDHGLGGLKLLCIGWYPDDTRIFPVYERAASLNMPILFHTGILASGRYAKYHRPAAFEIAREFPQLRIVMAHVSWPWTDEALAVAGGDARYEQDPQIYIDLTPGAPMPWQRDVIRKAIHYLDRAIMLFGTDATEASCGYGKKVYANMKFILDELGVSLDRQEDIFWNNAVSFYGD